MFPPVIDQANAVEDLHRRVGVHSRTDPGDNVHIAIDEFAQPAVVVHGRRSGSSADKELESGDAKCILDIDQHEIYAEFVLRGRLQLVLHRPLFGFFGPLLIGNFPHLADFIRVIMRRNG